jgi:hypothetical protein
LQTHGASNEKKYKKILEKKGREKKREIREK